MRITDWRKRSTDSRAKARPAIGGIKGRLLAAGAEAAGLSVPDVRTLDDLEDESIALSNLGAYDIDSFLGIVPTERPRLAILVVLDQPRGAHFGGMVAAPVFRSIASQALWHLREAIPVISSYGDALGIRAFANRVRLEDRTRMALERTYGVPVAAGRYWYDAFSGVWGMEGGPAQGQIHPGLQLGGPLRADASGGDTGVFVNGRQLHRLEVRLGAGHAHEREAVLQGTRGVQTPADQDQAARG